jgi:hypothetical protein
MMKLTNASGSTLISSSSELAAVIEALDPVENSFIVLGRDDLTYIQSAYEDGLLVVEKQDGDLDRHFRAWHTNGNDRFQKSDVQQLFEAYFRNEPSPMTIEWRPYRLDGSQLTLENIVRGFSVGKAVTLVVIVGAVYFLNRWFRGGF